MIQFKVNGIGRSFDGDPEMPLLWYLRDILDLTGTKFGCGVALLWRLYCSAKRGGDAVLCHSRA
jgi:isoquinoline 1-oxidoreductase subunit alpha